MHFRYPAILIVVATILLVGSCGKESIIYPKERALQKIDPEVRVLGAQHYADFCADCHGAAGEGQVGLYAPLVGSAIVNGSTQDLVRFMLTLERKEPASESYPPSMGKVDYLPAEDLGALLAYVSHAFGDSPKEISVEEIETQMAQ